MSGHQRIYHMRHLENRPHTVYVIWRGDRALYVGMTCDWATRLSGHWPRFFGGLGATHMDFWHVASTRTEAAEIEEQTIYDLDPLYNIEHSPSALVDPAQLSFDGL